MMILKICILPMLIKVLSKTHKPMVCAILYALIILTNGLIFDLAMGTPLSSVLIQLVVAFVASAVYFHLVEMMEGTGALYWLVLAGGAFALVYF